MKMLANFWAEMLPSLHHRASLIDVRSGGANPPNIKGVGFCSVDSNCLKICSSLSDYIPQQLSTATISTAVVLIL
jgi:hypothetical protein